MKAQVVRAALALKVFVLWCGAGCCVAKPELVFSHSTWATDFISAS